MPFPDLEGGLSGLFKIPLLAQVDTLRLQRKGDGFAERNGLAFGLLGDFQLLRDVDRDGVGGDAAAGGVGHHAVSPYTVP